MAFSEIAHKSTIMIKTSLGYEVLDHKSVPRMYQRCI